MHQIICNVVPLQANRMNGISAFGTWVRRWRLRVSPFIDAKSSACIVRRAWIRAVFVQQHAIPLSCSMFLCSHTAIIVSNNRLNMLHLTCMKSIIFLQPVHQTDASFVLEPDAVSMAQKATECLRMQQVNVTSKRCPFWRQVDEMAEPEQVATEIPEVQTGPRARNPKHCKALVPSLAELSSCHAPDEAMAHWRCPHSGCLLRNPGLLSGKLSRLKPGDCSCEIGP